MARKLPVRENVPQKKTYPVDMTDTVYAVLLVLGGGDIGKAVALLTADYMERLEEIGNGKQ